MEWTIPAFAFPDEAGTHLLTPEGWKAELALSSFLFRCHSAISGKCDGTQNVAIAMHCNLRPPVATPFIFHFSWQWQPRLKLVNYPFLSYSVLLLMVTFTSHAETLTFDLRNTSAVMWSNSVQHFSEIEQST